MKRNKQILYLGQRSVLKDPIWTSKKIIFPYSIPLWKWISLHYDLLMV